MVGKNLKIYKDCLPLVEFTYNKSIHSSTSYLPFDIVYDFNLLTPLDLLSLPLNEVVNVDGQQIVILVKSIHEKARQHIKEKNRKYAQRVNQD